MGIYSSGLSCYQRRMLGLKQDHAGPETIEEAVPEVVEEVVVEEKPVEEAKTTTKTTSTTEDPVRNEPKGVSGKAPTKTSESTKGSKK